MGKKQIANLKRHVETIPYKNNVYAFKDSYYLNGKLWKTTQGIAKRKAIEKTRDLIPIKKTAEIEGYGILSFFMIKKGIFNEIVHKSIFVITDIMQNIIENPYDELQNHSAEDYLVFLLYPASNIFFDVDENVIPIPIQFSGADGFTSDLYDINALEVELLRQPEKFSDVKIEENELQFILHPTSEEINEIIRNRKENETIRAAAIKLFGIEKFRKGEHDEEAN